MGAEIVETLVKALPRSLKERYGFEDPFDYSEYDAVKGPDYVYYPELSCIVMDGIEARWPKGTLDVNNPVHVQELRKRIKRRLNPNLIGTVRWLKPKNRMVCMFHSMVPNNFKWIPVDGTRIYYDPKEMDLRNDDAMALLAKCLFVGHRYKPVHVVPDMNEEPEFWEGNSL